jgi:NAD(P)-dependent dehydrogenase (short-subunit alcohol dehydrogenase family)
MSPLLQAAGSMDDSARVITVGSIAGIQIGNVGDNGTYGYAASKAAVHHLTKHLAVELAPRGILVNAIAPGFFITKMAKGLVELSGGEKAWAERSPNRRLGRPEDIAGFVVWLCSRAAAHCNGTVVPIDGGGALGGEIVVDRGVGVCTAQLKVILRGQRARCRGSSKMPCTVPKLPLYTTTNVLSASPW